MPSAKKMIVAAEPLTGSGPQRAGIVTRSPDTAHATTPPDRWQRDLATAVRSPAELLELLDLPRSAFPATVDHPEFPLLAPLPFVSRMRRGDPRDPLLLQILPRGEEHSAAPGYTVDPLAEQAAGLTPGLLQKYPGRALLIAAPACAVHCRYCFRRHYPYAQAASRPDAWSNSLARLTADPSISEVILSGGDPLMLSDERLTELIGAISEIPHIALLRIHTRLPIVIPSRVTTNLCTALTMRLRATVVIHCNHPAEIDDAVATAVEQLRNAGCTLLNQAVLLRDVNDSSAVLAELSRRLFDIGVLPYYLHLPDRVAGTAHFAVSEESGKRLIQTLRDALPGYLVPRLVKEIPGEKSKRLIL